MLKQLNKSPLTAGIRIAYLIKYSSDDELYQLFEELILEMNNRKRGYEEQNDAAIQTKTYPFNKGELSPEIIPIIDRMRQEINKRKEQLPLAHH